MINQRPTEGNVDIERRIREIKMKYSLDSNPTRTSMDTTLQRHRGELRDQNGALNYDYVRKQVQKYCGSQDYSVATKQNAYIQSSKVWKAEDFHATSKQFQTKATTGGDTNRSGPINEEQNNNSSFPRSLIRAGIDQNAPPTHFTLGRKESQQTLDWNGSRQEGAIRHERNKSYYVGEVVPHKMAMSKAIDYNNSTTATQRAQQEPQVHWAAKKQSKSPIFQSQRPNNNPLSQPSSQIRLQRGIEREVKGSWSKLQRPKTPIQAPNSGINLAYNPSYDRAKTLQKDGSTTNIRNTHSEAIQQQIKHLTDKIKKFEQTKQQLNISFKPFDMGQRLPSESNNQVQQAYRQAFVPQLKADRTNVPAPQAPQQQRFFTPKKQAVVKPDFREKVSPIYSLSTLTPAQLKSKPQGQSGFKINLIPVSQPEDSSEASQRVNQNPSYSKDIEAHPLQRPSYISPMEASCEADRQKSISSQIKERVKHQESSLRSEFEKKTDEGIEARKKKLQPELITNSSKSKKMINAFIKQVQLDEELRNCKIWFHQQHATEQGWKELGEAMEAVGFRKMGLNSLQEELRLHQSEHNPFFSISEVNCSYKALVNAYKTATDNWEREIRGQFTVKELENQNFSENKVDLTRKGYILVQDLVRFLNIQSGTFFRNRDLSLVYLRLSQSGPKIKFEDLVRLLTSQ